MQPYSIFICSILLCCIESTALAAASSHEPLPVFRQTIGGLLCSEGVRRYEHGQTILSIQATKKKLIKRMSTPEFEEITEQTFEPFITDEINNFNTLIVDAGRIGELFTSRNRLAEQFYQPFTFTYSYEQPWYGQAYRTSSSFVDPNADDIVHILPVDHLYTLQAIKKQFVANNMKIERISTFLNNIRTGDKDTDREFFKDLKNRFINVSNTEFVSNRAPRNINVVELARTWFNNHDLEKTISNMSGDDATRRIAAWNALETEKINELRQREADLFAQAVARGQERNPIQQVMQPAMHVPQQPALAIPLVNAQLQHTIRISPILAGGMIGSTMASAYFGSMCLLLPPSAGIEKKEAIFCSLFPPCAIGLTALFSYLCGNEQFYMDVPHWKAYAIAAASLMGFNALLWRHAYLQSK